MSPIEVIAMALSNRATCHEDDWDWFDMAVAVIDALQRMPVTEAMQEKAFKWEGSDDHVAVLWRAMVGAMRDEV